MKFESKFGVGEVCIYNHESSHNPDGVDKRTMPDELVKIIGVFFDLDGGVTYHGELMTKSAGIQRLQIHEGMLLGDDDFDQEEGRYLNDDDCPF